MKNIFNENKPIENFILNYPDGAILTKAETNEIIIRNDYSEQYFGDGDHVNYDLLIKEANDPMIEANFQFCKFVDRIFSENGKVLFADEIFNSNCYSTVRIPVNYKNENCCLLLITKIREQTDNNLINKMMLA